jgi:hypothetical protein
LSKAQRAANLIAHDSDFGCQEESVKKLVALLLNIDDLPEPSPAPDERPFVIGSLVRVPETSQTVLITAVDDASDAQFQTADGKTSLSNGDNWLYNSQRDLFTVPTARQIDAFLKAAGLE